MVSRKHCHFFVWNVFTMVAPLSWRLAKVWEFTVYFLYTLPLATNQFLELPAMIYVHYNGCLQNQSVNQTTGWIQAKNNLFLEGSWELLNTASHGFACNLAKENLKCGLQGW